MLLTGTLRELESRKNEITGGDFLTFGLRGKFGFSDVVVVVVEGRKL